MNCNACGFENDDDSLHCIECGERIEVEGDSTGGVIPYKNAPALVAYYLGLFSILPIIGLPMGITAVILGVKGLSQRARTPAVKGSVHAWVGIGCGGFCAAIWLLVVAVFIVGLFATGK